MATGAGRTRRSNIDTYLLVHRHPNGYQSGLDTLAWKAWFEQLGETLVDLGNPVLDERDAVGDTGTALPLGGSTIITDENPEDATRLANRCPVIQDGGGVGIGGLTPVPGRKHPACTF